MKRLKRGYYTCDICETYWHIVPKYYGEGYVKAVVTMYYKNGEYKDYLVDKKKFKLYNDKVTHWKEYKRD